LEQNAKDERGLVLGISLITMLLLLLLVTIYLGLDDGVRKPKAANIVGAVLFQALGVLFLLSYFYSHKTFFFRWLVRICVYNSRPSGRAMAFIWFALFFGLGTAGLLDAL
jgi:hypothetical protein